MGVAESDTWRYGQADLWRNFTDASSWMDFLANKRERPVAVRLPDDRKFTLFWWAGVLTYKGTHKHRAFLLTDEYPFGDPRESVLGSIRSDRDYNKSKHSWQDSALMREVFVNPYADYSLDLDDPSALPEIKNMAEEAYRKIDYRECDAVMLGPHEDKLIRCQKCAGVGYVGTFTIDPVRLSIIADALQDAGCNQTELINHLRGRRSHMRCAECSDREYACRKCLDGFKRGWDPLPTPHYRGCWALDLLRGV